jgi:hypothetical protein
MSLHATIRRLTPAQLKELASSMLDAGIAMENGRSYQEAFLVAKKRHKGAMRKMYKRLAKSTPRQIENMAQNLENDYGKAEQE